MKRTSVSLSLLVCVLALACAGPASADSTGGAKFVPPPPPPKKAKIVHGKAIAPRNAPRKVRQIIKAGNRIIGKPYVWGGGHATFSRMDRGYDCSGSVSFALHGARLLHTPMASGDLMHWAHRGTGRWVTVYASGGHAYMVVAGLRLDTSMRDNPNRTGPQWSKRLRRNASFRARHPRGL